MCRARVIVVDAGVNSELNAAAPVSHLSDERAAAAAADPKIAFPGNVHANHSRISVVRIQMSIYQCGEKEQNRMIFLAAHSWPPLPFVIRFDYFCAYDMQLTFAETGASSSGTRSST